MAELIRDIERLSMINGVSGNEGDVRNLVKDRIKPYADSVTTDSMGNVIAFKKGTDGKNTLLLSAHMDEIGLIISKIEDSGYLRFKPVGDVDSAYLVSKSVTVGKKVKGVLGMKAIHLQKKEEREDGAPIKDLYIDIGAENADKAKKRVELGDYASFNTRFYETQSCVIGKALESRIGVAVLCDLIRETYSDDVYFVFTVQKEVGMRGASVAAYGLDVDAALVIDGAESADMYGSKPEQRALKVGGGICVPTADKYALADRDLSEKFLKALRKGKIRVQDKCSAAGFSDAGAFKETRDGIKSASVMIPVRYAGTPAQLAAKADIESLKDAAKLFIERVGEILK